MTYSVSLTRRARRDLESIPSYNQQKIAKKIDALAHDPRMNGVVKLEGNDELYRLRFGDYRIIFSIEDRELVVLVIRVSHRRDAYR